MPHPPKNITVNLYQLVSVNFFDRFVFIARLFGVAGAALGESLTVNGGCSEG